MQPDFIWKIVPTSLPLAQRNCKRCKKKRQFYCSEKFRINAHQKKLDVWLIYKCAVCDSTWNCTVLSRVNPQNIEPALYEKLQNNDREAAWAYAFKYELLKRNGAQVDPNVDYEIEGEKIDLTQMSAEKISILLTFDYPLDIRLSTPLSKMTGQSHERLEAWLASGAIEIYPQRFTDLKKKLKDKAFIILHGAQLKAALTTEL